VSWNPLVKSNANAVMTTMIMRNKLMFTGPDSCSRGIRLSNRELGKSQVDRESSLDVTFQLTGRSPRFTSGVSAQRMVARNLDED